MSSFAPPLSKLSESGIGVAAAPTGGMGLALDDKGFVPASALVEAWREVGTTGQPAFEGTWVNFGGIVETLRFRKDAMGMVHIHGTVKSGTINTKVFTLPEGYRPRAYMEFPSTANAAFGYLTVEADGDVVPVSGATSSFAINISFFAA